jgi:O-antigen/teichoic acid export membrane protein
VPEPPASVADEPDRQLRRLARGGLLSVGGSIVSSVAGIALVAAVTNSFSQADAGTLFATTSVFIIVTAITQLGTEIGLVRWIPVLRATGRQAELWAVLRIAMLPVAVVSVLAGIALFVLADPAAAQLVGEAKADDGAVMLRCLAVGIPLGSLYHAILAATRGMGSMRPTVVADAVLRSAGQPVAVLVVVVAGGGTLALVLAWLLPYAVACCWAAVALARQTRRATANAAARPADRRGGLGRLAGEFWRFTGPRVIASVSQVALKRLDIVLVAALRSPAEAAIYTAATRFVVLGQLAVQSIQQALSPQLSLLFARNDIAGARRIFQTATSWMMLPAWPLYLTCAAVAPLILSVFGEGYSKGNDVIVILALAMLFATACGSVDTVLLMAGRSWLSLLNNVGALVANVALNLVLIPEYGLVGAAWAWAGAIVVRNVLPSVQIRRLLGVTAGGRAAGVVAGSALVCFGVPGLVLSLASVPQWVVLTVLVVLGGSAYAAAMWRGREVLHLPLLAGTLVARLRRSPSPEPAPEQPLVTSEDTW